MRKIILWLLRQMAVLQLKKHSIPIIGVTGSVGKTSCVKAIFEILSTCCRVKRTPKSLNSEFGIPLTILGQETGYRNPFKWLRALLGAAWTLAADWRKYDYLIFEMGVDKPGDMEYLLSFIRPQIGVVLNVAPVHTEQFAGFEDPLAAIREEKLKLVKSLLVEGVTIVGEGFQIETTPVCLIRFGYRDDLEVVICQANSSETGLEFEVDFEGQKQKFNLPQVLGEGYAETLTAAIIVGQACGVSWGKITAALQNFRLPPGRMSLIPGIKDTLLIDSSYNASPKSMRMALEVLVSFSSRRRVAVLGDMRELGPLAKSEHQKLARQAVQAADELILVGPLMEKYFLPEARQLGFAREEIHAFGSPFQAGQFVKEQILQGGEVILCKGSQNTIFLEEAVKVLMKEPDKAGELLCRQEPEWLEIKKSYR